MGVSYTIIFCILSAEFKSGVLLPQERWFNWTFDVVCKQEHNDDFENLLKQQLKLQLMLQ